MPAFKRAKVIGRESFPRGLLTNQLRTLKKADGRAHPQKKKYHFLGQRDQRAVNDI